MLDKRISELEAKLNTNSSNSSIPPSKDSFDRSAPKSLRNKSGKKPGGQPGGQPGHKGNGLRLECEPDEVIEHKAVVCTNCGADISDVNCTCVNTSNVIDFKIITLVIQHKQMRTVCPNCGTDNYGKMPKEAIRSVCYGSGLRAFAALLTNYCCVSIKKTCDLLTTVFNMPISTGTIANINSDFASKCQPHSEAYQFVCGSLTIHDTITNKRLEKRGLTSLSNLYVKVHFDEYF